MNNIPKWLVLTVGGLLAVFLVLASLQRLLDYSRSLSGTLSGNTIMVSADGKAKAVPDVAMLSLGLVTQSKTAQEAEKANSEKFNKIVDYVKAQGVEKEDISTSQYTIYPTYNYSTSQNTISGYELRQTVTVKIHGVDQNIEQLNRVLRGAIENGANEISGVSLTFENQDELTNKARTEAIAKAKEKAVQMAKETGLKLGKILSVNEYMQTPMYYDGKGGMGGSASPNIEPGSQEIVLNVNLTFAVK